MSRLFISLCLLAFVALLGSSSDSFAQCRNRVVFRSPVVTSSHVPFVSSSKVVVANEVVPVAVPLVFTVAVPVPTVSYLYNGGSAYAPVTNGNGHVKLSEADIEDIIRRVEARLRVKAPEYGPPPVPDKVAQPKEVKVEYSIERVTSILKNNCAKCHTEPTHKGSIKIFLADGKLNPNAPKYKIWDAADAGIMPPAAKTDVNQALSDDDVNVLRIWARTE